MMGQLENAESNQTKTDQNGRKTATKSATNSYKRNTSCSQTVRELNDSDQRYLLQKIGPHHRPANSNLAPYLQNFSFVINVLYLEVPHFGTGCFVCA